MNLAILEAKKTTKEVPIGCIIVDKNGKVTSASHNKSEELLSPIMHAEIICINNAIDKTGEKYLNDFSMYVTLEPCIMCFGAICNARVGSIFIGSKKDESKSITLLNKYNSNHKPDVYFDIMKDECDELINTFFQKLR